MKVLKFLIQYSICLILVSMVWVGLEYRCEGTVHTSDVDGIVAMILSYFIIDKYF